jgi:hypothetical protein
MSHGLSSSSTRALLEALASKRYEDGRMAYREGSSEARRDAQSVEIALALFAGVGVFLGLVVLVAVLAHITGLSDGTGWGPAGVVLAAVAGLLCMTGVPVRARKRSI